MCYNIPEKQKDINDNFSNKDFDNWLTDKARGTWSVTSSGATAFSSDADRDHYLLPLKWKENTKPKKYQLEVDVKVKGTDGLGGLYFAGNDEQANVIYLSDDRVNVGQVTNTKTAEISKKTSTKYELDDNNRLKVVVDGDHYQVYINNKFVFEQKTNSVFGTRVGLYLQKEATKDLPEKYTTFDNFTFKVLD